MRAQGNNRDSIFLFCILIICQNCYICQNYDINLNKFCSSGSGSSNSGSNSSSL